MTAQRGRDLLLKISDGAGGFATVAGVRARSLSFNTRAVDVTNADSAGAWRELLAGAGAKSAALAGSGIFRDQPSDMMVRIAFFEGRIETWQVVIPDFGTVEGPFQVVSLSYEGQHDGEVGFSIALESAGALSFTGV
ncbi:phage major tail protein, TP901-1 family [Futiania mangrovi]|uniref:Phage major tail protein, TP901-1 family n=1 Tax=Futiania mangrovi TaxID=2959716 RepID=A0A9J6PFN6_9PROT|nr:phage major tail protein, TP901-1 family [Futiania mangrovii]MCP1337278.1 phage major tail protein, TP901-1 family [Futiania mangrovii]